MNLSDVEKAVLEKVILTRMQGLRNELKEIEDFLESIGESLDVKNREKYLRYQTMRASRIFALNELETIHSDLKSFWE